MISEKLSQCTQTSENRTLLSKQAMYVTINRGVSLQYTWNLCELGCETNLTEVTAAISTANTGWISLPVLISRVLASAQSDRKYVEHCEGPSQAGTESVGRRTFKGSKPIGVAYAIPRTLGFDSNADHFWYL